MKRLLNLFWCFAMMAATSSVYAQKDASSLDSLKKQIGFLQQQLEELKNKSTTVKTVESDSLSSVNDTVPADSLLQDQIRDLMEKVNSVSNSQKQSRPNLFNPSIGLVGEEITSYRTKGLSETGSDRPGGIDVNIRSVELDVAASIDPFAKGYAVINASVDVMSGEANWGVEEAALQTTSLPWNLDLKAGRFFAEFGRLSYIHDHELPFVNRPLVLDEYVGGESRTDGFQLNWLVPLQHYINLTIGAGNQFGSDFPPNNPGNTRNFNELNYWGRLSSYFDLTPNWQVEMGISGLLNPRTEDRGGVLDQPDGSTLTEKERRLADADFSLKWVPLANNEFQSLTWGNEVLYSDNRYWDSLPTGAVPFDISVGAWGLYSYVTYRFSRGWSVGFLFDWVQNDQNARDHTFGYSPYITWALSHWNFLRLQYTRTENNHVLGLSGDDAVYLQWAWIIGSHSHGWKQR
jgi:hypothetical protein